MKAVHALATTALLLSGVLTAQAQVQRIVGPDGRITYTDGVGAAAAGVSGASGPSPAASPAGETSPTLPYALRQTIQRYPVTLYSGNQCAPCNSARQLLQKRGVPFTEKTVTTPADAQAFAALGVDNSLPLITVGAQRIIGFQATELNRYLDAAGYPAESRLPRNHRNPAPQALAPTASPPNGPASAGNAPAPASSAAPEAPTPAPVSPPASNPAGIRF